MADETTSIARENAALKDNEAVHLEIIAERDAFIETLMETVEALRAAYKAHKVPDAPEEVKEVVEWLYDAVPYNYIDDADIDIRLRRAADLLEQQAQEIEELKHDIAWKVAIIADQQEEIARLREQLALVTPDP